MFENTEIYMANLCSSAVLVWFLFWFDWTGQVASVFCLTQWIPYIKPSLPAYKNLLVYNLVFTILLWKTRKNRQLMKQEYLLTWLFGQVSSHCYTTSYFKSCCLFSPIRLFFCLMRETMLRKTKTMYSLVCCNDIIYACCDRLMQFFLKIYISMLTVSK